MTWLDRAATPAFPLELLMLHPVPRPLRTVLTTFVATFVAGVLAVTTLLLVGGVDRGTDADAEAGSPAPVAAQAAARRSTNPPTPGDFTGYGFDQCLAPTQKAMNRWLKRSPYLAVGIYISGDSRACRSQPNLTPDWIATQLRRGWRLLPITLGPQASCQPRFPRYRDDVTIDPKPGANGRYDRARSMGSAEATKAVAAAKALGIVPGSTLWYDLEGYDNKNTHCRESAMAFLSSWTIQIRKLGYVSGVYSSAGSGILQLDRIRATNDTRYTIPDRIWIARWDGKANTSTSYISEAGWRPGGRVKQYLGGHDEKWGGVRINIDTNYLDLGRGSVAAPESHCGGVRVDFRKYRTLVPPNQGKGTPPAKFVRALQCLLKEQGAYAGRLTGNFNRATLRAARSWSAANGLPVANRWSRRHWSALLVEGSRAVVKVGSAGPEVRRIQRALNAVIPKYRLQVTGVFDTPTKSALRAWQDRVEIPRSGVAAGQTWRLLAKGYRSR